MAAREKPRVRFGLFQLDLHCGELSKGELKLKLQGQPIELLSALLERPGELVTREELRQRLWPRDTFVDFEHSLNTAVRKLRQALGDEADTPRYIETLPKRGYRFIGEILDEEAATPSFRADGEGVLRRGRDLQPQIVTSNPPVRRQLRPAWAIRLKFATLATLVLLVLFWGFRASRSPKTLELLATPLTSYSGGEWEPALSPDGTMVAFAWDEGEKWGLNAVYVKTVGGAENALRIGPPGSACPAWSPQGNLVAFVYVGDPQPGIYVASPLGGPIKMLLGRNILSYGRLKHPAPAHCSLSWSPDGASLLFTGAESNPLSRQAIYKLNLGDGRVTQISHPPQGIWGDFSAQFSPDGRSIAFARWTSADVADVYTVSGSGGKPKQLTHDNAIIRGLVWTSDGKELLVATGRRAETGGRLSLWRVRVSDGGLRRLPLPTLTAWQPTISRRGSRLVFTAGQWGTGIREVKLKGNLPERKVYSSTLDTLAGGYSPNGTKIAFNSVRSGRNALWVANQDGSGLMELASETGLGSPQWSPDGKTIAYDAEPAANASLFTVLANGGAAKRLTAGNAKDVVPRWSRDSKWIYFSSNRTGAWQIFKMPAEGGQAKQVTRDGGLFAQESLDGSKLYFLKPEKNATLDRSGPGIWVKSLTSGAEAMVKGTEGVNTRHFAIGKWDIYFVELVNGRPVLRILELRTGRIQTLRTLEHHVFGTPTLVVSPDESTLLYTSMDAAADLMLVDNFQ